MTGNFATSQSGAPLASDEHSLTAGPDGSIVLHDRFLVEKLAAFNRDRVPERNRHAKAGGAFGGFPVTGDVSQYMRAAVFQQGIKSEILLRFSSVAGEQGSPDTVRDVRGYSLRFPTTEANYGVVPAVPVPSEMTELSGRSQASSGLMPLHRAELRHFGRVGMKWRGGGFTSRPPHLPGECRRRQQRSRSRAVWGRGSTASPYRRPAAFRAMYVSASAGGRSWGAAVTTSAPSWRTAAATRDWSSSARSAAAAR